MNNAVTTKKVMQKVIAQLIILAALSVESVSAFDINDEVKSIVKSHAPELISVFKQFHQNPELGFQEYETAKTIATHLTNLGYAVTTGVGGTGVVAVIENGPGPAVIFRSDMDALPVKESTNISYKSIKTMVGLDGGMPVPVMHACGHDAHATWIIGIAKVMMELKDHWNGTLILVAQPAEELLSGAHAMVSDGLLDIVPEPDYIIAGHQLPIWPLGSVALSDGYRMAGSIQMDVVINGKGGHGSVPHLTIDPVLMGSQAVMAYQTIISRMVDQGKGAVLTVGAFHAGNANNVISDSVDLKLNLRWYDPSVRDAMVNGIKAVTDNIAEMNGVGAEAMPTYIIKSEVPPVFHDSALTQRARISMKRLLGEEQVRSAGKPHMGSEDFHMLAGNNSNARVLLVEIGSGQPDVISKIESGKMPVFPHNPNFFMEPEAVLYGAQALSAVLLDLLQEAQAE